MSSISRIVQPLERPPNTISRWRAVVGISASVTAVFLVILFTLGSWNPWNNVLLLSYFADPFRGLIAVAVLAYVSLWLLLPVRSEATQRRRLGARVVVVVLAFVGLMGFGLYGTHFYDYDSEEIARSPEGTRAVGIVTQSEVVDARYHVFDGEGLMVSDVGDFAPVCGSGDEIRFSDENTIQVSNAYGEFVIPLDEATGQPQDMLVTCFELLSESVED